MPSTYITLTLYIILNVNVEYLMILVVTATIQPGSTKFAIQVCLYACMLSWSTTSIRKKVRTEQFSRSDAQIYINETPPYHVNILTTNLC